MQKVTGLNEEQQLLQASEYVDCLLTLDLAVLLNGEESKVIRQCAYRLHQRIKSVNIKMIMFKVYSSPAPKRQLRELKEQIVGHKSGGYSLQYKEFISMGIEADTRLRMQSIMRL